MMMMDGLDDADGLSDSDNGNGGNDNDGSGRNGNDSDSAGKYVAQLHRVFEDCDRSGHGYLGRAELLELCGKLNLQDQSGYVLSQLLGDGDDVDVGSVGDPEAKLDFDEFKEKFVCLLAQSVNGQQQFQQQSTTADLQHDHEPIVVHLEEPIQQLEREVDPKYVWGSKEYGRRSRPDVDSSSSITSYSTTSSADASGTDGEDQLPSNLVSLTSSSTSTTSEDVFIPSVDRTTATGPIHSSMSSSPSSSSSVLAAGDRDVSSSSVGAIVRPRESSYNGKQLRAKRRRRMESSNNNDIDHDSVIIQDQPNSTTKDEEEEYLRSIWLKLGVGTDGYLDLLALTQVCEYIGMEKMSEEVVDQLFEKLDVDRDGRIHFDEFMHLFRTGDPSYCQQSRVPAPSTSVDNSLAPSNPSVDRAHSCGIKVESGSTDSANNSGCNPGESGIFGSIDPQGTGYAEQEAVLELWDSLGITDGFSILKELGFHTNSQICLLDLTHIFEEILQMSSCADSELINVAVACLIHELKFLRRTMHQLRLERDYLLVDVADANSRAMLIAQEVDETQVKLEQKNQENLTNLNRKYQEQVRRLKEELECEQDAWNEQMSKLKSELQSELSARQEGETRHRERLADLEKEVHEAIRDKHRLERRLAEADRRHLERRMEKEENISRPIDDEDDRNSNEDRCVRLALELEMTKAANKQLQDRNDELCAKVDKLKVQLSTKLSLESTDDEIIPMNSSALTRPMRNELDIDNPNSSFAHEMSSNHRRSGSWLSDYVKDGEVLMHGSTSTSGDAKITISDDNWFQPNNHEEDDDDIEEYMPLCPRIKPVVIDQLNYVEGAEPKLEMKKVFAILKKRIIENYLEEINQSSVDPEHSSRISSDHVNRRLLCQRVIDVPSVELTKEMSDNLSRKIVVKKILSDSGYDDDPNNYSQTSTPKGHQQNAIDSESGHQNLMEMMINMESRCIQLQDQLESKEASLKTNLLKSEMFWREQVEQERVEMETDRAALESKILQLQFQLDTVRHHKDETDNNNIRDECVGVPVRRTKSCRDQDCSSGSLSRNKREVTVRRCFSGRSTSSSTYTKSSFDTDSLEEPDDCHNRTIKLGCPHIVPCCDKLDLYKWQLLNCEQQRQSLERDVKRIPFEFLTRGTPLERCIRFDDDTSKSNCLVDMEMLHTINQHVRQQEQRCRHLEASMVTGQMQTDNQLREMRRLNDEELRKVNELLSKTRVLLKEQMTKVREQNEKLLQSDVLVKELYVDNAQLVKSVQLLDEKQRITECANFGLQQKINALNQLLGDVFRSPAPYSSL